MKNSKLSSLVLVALLLALTSLPALATMQQQRNMLDQLDQLDHQEFLALTEKAYVCIHSRDFGCAESKLTKASKYLTNPQDRKALKIARKDLAAERRFEQEEIAAAAEQARQEQLARQRAAEAEAERQRREERAQQEASNDNLARGLFAIGTGAYIGSVTKNADLGVAAAKSVYTGDMEGFNSAVDQAKAEREQAYNAKMAAIREQRAREGAERAERAQRERMAREEQYERAKREREERASADHRRKTAREQAAHAEAQRKADTQLAQEKTQIRQQEQELLEKADARKRKSEADAQRNRDAEALKAQRVAEKQRLANQEQKRAQEEARKKEATRKEVVHGPEQLEAVAVCWQSKRNSEHYRCDGPTQDTILSDDTLDHMLDSAGCPKPRATDGSREIRGGTAIVYLCGFGLWYETDVAKKYGITVQRNKYQCSGSTSPTAKCKENFQLTD